MKEKIILKSKEKISNTRIGAARRAGIQKTTKLRRCFTRPLSYYASQLPGGKARFMEYARLASDKNEKVKLMIDCWDSLSKSDRRYISLDELAESVGIHYKDLFFIVGMVIPENDSLILLAASTRRRMLIERILASALGNGPNSQKDRLALLQYYDIFPTYSLDAEYESDDE